ncbi:hypothetical protein [Bacillus wiedmannii]|uniref:hypothetical protein n=1 Tax=Bacillus wiedmannii TaxID=1890302 RepID=UPI000BF82565|nr:hypothetical protein [Bacillus wiedmannii]PGD94987.1 hypothetical protein COM48_14655 [Bacillus wiedmannii]
MFTTFHIEEDDLEELSSFSDASFDIEYSIEQAKGTLAELQHIHKDNECAFESDFWKVISPLTETFVNMRFDEIRDIAICRKDLDEELFVKIVKSWVAYRMEETEPASAAAPLYYLKLILTWTNCFNSNETNIEELKYQLYNLEEYKRRVVCVIGLNFLDFCMDLDDQIIYSKLLTEIKEEISVKALRRVRELPTPKEILVFSNVLEDFFANISIPSVEYFRFFSVYLWWNITSVIPIRPSEFATIRRDGFIYDRENKEFYIKLPRSSKGYSVRKSSNKNKIQIVDTIRISPEIGKKIQQYIELTEPFGYTRTLLSYPAWFKAGSRAEGNPKIFKDWYSRNVLRTHLQLFHNEILAEMYGVSIRPSGQNTDSKLKVLPSNKYDLDRVLRPGDTRHIAFINMMRQGFHPIEIARLGGHTEINSQYHYHQHADRFVDTEILKLMSKFSSHHQNTLNKKMISGKVSITETEFKKKFVFKPLSSLQVKRKLNDGYCLEPNQRCPVDECLMCDFWGIDLDEYVEKRNMIKARIAEIYDDTKKLMVMLIDLHKYVINNFFDEPDASEDSIALNKDLVTLSKQLDDALIRLAKLNTLEKKVVGSRDEN